MVQLFPAEGTTYARLLHCKELGEFKKQDPERLECNHPEARGKMLAGHIMQALGLS